MSKADKFAVKVQRKADAVENMQKRIAGMKQKALQRTEGVSAAEAAREPVAAQEAARKTAAVEEASRIRLCRPRHGQSTILDLSHIAGLVAGRG